MGWKKGTPRKAQTAPKDTTIKPEAPVATPEPVKPSIKPSTEEVAQENCWRYHKDNQPKAFKKGETIPAGWAKSPADIPDFPWEHDGSSGVWTRKEGA